MKNDGLKIAYRSKQFMQGNSNDSSKVGVYIVTSHLWSIDHNSLGFCFGNNIHSYQVFTDKYVNQPNKPGLINLKRKVFQGKIKLIIMNSIYDISYNLSEISDFLWFLQMHNCDLLVNEGKEMILPNQIKLLIHEASVENLKKQVRHELLEKGGKER